MEVYARGYGCDGDVGWVFGVDSYDDVEYDEDDWHQEWETYGRRPRVRGRDRARGSVRVRGEDRARGHERIVEKIEFVDKNAFVDNEFVEKVGLEDRIGFIEFVDTV
mgnify:CR=1 FL=1